MTSRIRSAALRAMLGLLAVLVVVAPALLGWSAGGTLGTTTAVVAFTALAAAVLAVRVMALQVPVRVHARAATWPGHPARRAGGDLPRQLHPDTPGRSRPRAPGAR